MGSTLSSTRERGVTGQRELSERHDARTSSSAPPVQVIHRLQRTVGNRAVAAALSGGRTLLAQRAPSKESTSPQKKLFTPPSHKLPMKYLPHLDNIRRDPLAWKRFCAFAAKENTLDTDVAFYDEYARCRDGNREYTQKLYDMAVAKDFLNITEPQQEELKAEASKVFFGRPLAIFNRVAGTVCANLVGDGTFTHFRGDDQEVRALAKAGYSQKRIETDFGMQLDEKLKAELFPKNKGLFGNFRSALSQAFSSPGDRAKQDVAK